MTHSTTKVHKSKVLPEVSFIVRKPTHGLRMQIQHTILKHTVEKQRLGETLAILQADMDEFKSNNPKMFDSEFPDGYVFVADIDVRNETYQNGKIILNDLLEKLTETGLIEGLHIDPVYIDRCLLSVEGVELEDEEGDVITLLPEDVLSEAPEALAKEIVEIIKNDYMLSDAVIESLESGSISGAVEEGNKKTTTAEVVKSGDSIELETVTNISQN